MPNECCPRLMKLRAGLDQDWALLGEQHEELAAEVATITIVGPRAQLIHQALRLVAAELLYRECGNMLIEDACS